MTSLQAKIVAMFVFFPLVVSSRADSLEQYTVGIDDHIALKVWDVRNGEPYQWVALNNEFTVDSGGNLSLPLIGDVHVAGDTTSKISDKVGAMLQSKVGLSVKPVTSVQVVKYRPFYIIGDVQRPGRYEYTPGLNVVQALSIAEGLYRGASTDAMRLQREIISGFGDTDLLYSERHYLLVKQARLLAEVRGASKIEFPPEILKLAADPVMSKSISEEELLFKNRREALQSQINSVEQNKSVIISQISALKSKDASLAKQLDLLKKDLSQVNELMVKGMAIASRQLGAEQNVANYESNRIDVQVAILKAQHDLAQADRDATDLKSKFLDGSLAEATEIRAKLEANNQKTITARSLIQQSNENLDSVAPVGLEGVKLSIYRSNGNRIDQISASDTVGPGDVLSVSTPRYLKSNNFRSPSERADVGGSSMER